MRATSVSDAMDVLDGALVPSDARALDDDGLIQAIKDIEFLSRKVAALQLAVAAEAKERSTQADPDRNLSWKHGCRNAIELLQQLTQSRRCTAAQWVRHGAMLMPRQGFSGELLPPEYPVVADALAAGSLGAESARVIVDSLERTRHKIPTLEQPTAEQYLVAGATGGLSDDGTLPVHLSDSASEPNSLPEHADEVRVRCRALALYFDQDGSEPTDRAAVRRGFRFGKLRDGLVPVSGALLPETAALLGRLFDAINSPRTAAVPAPPVRDVSHDESFTHYNESEYVPFDPEKPGRTVRFEPAPEQEDTHPFGTTTGTAITGTATTGTDASTNAPIATEADFHSLHALDARSADHKRHDALTALLTAAAKHAETPTLGGAPVTVLIQATADTLDPTKRSGKAWLHDHEGSHSPARAVAVRHAACSGGLQRITQAANGRIVEISSDQRVFNAHQRRAIMLRDGGCIIPGCTTPATWCEIHHVTEWARGGKTHTDNGVLMCFFHHRYLEVSGWSVRMRDGTPQVKPPERLHGNSIWWSVRPATRPPVLHAA